MRKEFSRLSCTQYQPAVYSWGYFYQNYKKFVSKNCIAIGPMLKTCPIPTRLLSCLITSSQLIPVHRPRARPTLKMMIGTGYLELKIKRRLVKTSFVSHYSDLTSINISLVGFLRLNCYFSSIGTVEKKIQTVQFKVASADNPGL